MNFNNYSFRYSDNFSTSAIHQYDYTDNTHISFIAFKVHITKYRYIKLVNSDYVYLVHLANKVIISNSKDMDLLKEIILFLNNNYDLLEEFLPKNDINPEIQKFMDLLK